MRRSTIVMVALIVSASAAPTAVFPQEGMVTARSHALFAKVTEALEQAITDQKMALVCHTDAQKGAAARGVALKGNQVLMVRAFAGFAADLTYRRPPQAHGARGGLSVWGAPGTVNAVPMLGRAGGAIAA